MNNPIPSPRGKAPAEATPHSASKAPKSPRGVSGDSKPRAYSRSTTAKPSSLPVGTPAETPVVADTIKYSTSISAIAPRTKVPKAKPEKETAGKEAKRTKKKKSAVTDDLDKAVTSKKKTGHLRRGSMPAIPVGWQQSQPEERHVSSVRRTVATSTASIPVVASGNTALDGKRQESGSTITRKAGPPGRRPPGNVHKLLERPVGEATEPAASYVAPATSAAASLGALVQSGPPLSPRRLRPVPLAPSPRNAEERIEANGLAVVAERSTPVRKPGLTKSVTEPATGTNFGVSSPSTFRTHAEAVTPIPAPALSASLQAFSAERSVETHDQFAARMKYQMDMKPNPWAKFLNGQHDSSKPGVAASGLGNSSGADSSTQVSARTPVGIAQPGQPASAAGIANPPASLRGSLTSEGYSEDKARTVLARIDQHLPKGSDGIVSEDDCLKAIRSAQLNSSEKVMLIDFGVRLSFGADQTASRQPALAIRAAGLISREIANLLLQ